MRVRFLTFWSEGFLRLGVRDSYVEGLVFLRLGVRDFFGSKVSFLKFGGSFSYVWGLVILTFVG